jgi:Txe/YoeB family toxin of Txe-Axe toxin-antitoxin module
MRTWKKIEETKKRATEVVSLKQKNEFKIHQKMEQLRVNQMMQDENQMRINQMRKQRDMERQKIQEAIYLSKKEEVK